MKTVTFAGDSRIEVKDVTAPDLQPGEVLVKVGASAICGSEMKRFRAPDPLSGNPGHEIVGEVVQRRSDTGPSVGDRVAVNIITGCGECATCRAGDRRFCDRQGYVFNGHAEFVVTPAINCMPLPGDVPFDEGVLIGGDTLGVAFHALSKICLRPRDTVAVVGCGPVGLGFVRLLSFYGVRTIAAEVSPYRRELARRLGAEDVVDPGTDDGAAIIREMGGGRGVDIGIDASGTDAGVNLRSTRRGTKEHSFLRGLGTRPRSIRGRSSWRRSSLRTVSGTSSIETTSDCSISTGKVLTSPI